MTPPIPLTYAPGEKSISELKHYHQPKTNRRRGAIVFWVRQVAGEGKVFTTRVFSPHIVNENASAICRCLCERGELICVRKGLGGARRPALYRASRKLIKQMKGK